jgi:hypothetical protein
MKQLDPAMKLLRSISRLGLLKYHENYRMEDSTVQMRKKSGTAIGKEQEREQEHRQGQEQGQDQGQGQRQSMDLNQQLD